MDFFLGVKNIGLLYGLRNIHVLNSQANQVVDVDDYAECDVTVDHCS